MRKMSGIDAQLYLSDRSRSLVVTSGWVVLDCCKVHRAVIEALVPHTSPACAATKSCHETGVLPRTHFSTSCLHEIRKVFDTTT